MNLHQTHIAAIVPKRLMPLLVIVLYRRLLPNGVGGALQQSNYQQFYYWPAQQLITQHQHNGKVEAYPLRGKRYVYVESI